MGKSSSDRIVVARAKIRNRTSTIRMTGVSTTASFFVVNLEKILYLLRHNKLEQCMRMRKECRNNFFSVFHVSGIQERSGNKYETLGSPCSLLNCQFCVD